MTLMACLWYYYVHIKLKPIDMWYIFQARLCVYFLGILIHERGYSSSLLIKSCS